MGIRTSVNMRDQINNYSSATYLKGTNRQAHPVLLQDNARILNFLNSAVQLASGAIPTFINADGANTDAALASGSISEVNRVNVTYNENTGIIETGFQITGKGVYTGAYPEGTAPDYSYEVKIIHDGWNQITTGWQWHENGKFKKEGWLQDNEKWYYFRGEWMQVDWQQISYKRETDTEEKTYYFYFRPDINSEWRQTRGDMVTSWFEIECEGSLQWFYFHGDGTMATSEWINYKDDWYYMRSNGPMLTSNWKQGKKGEWYYLKSDGKMAINEDITVDDVTYRADKDGVCTEKEVTTVNSAKPFANWTEQQKIDYIAQLDYSSEAKARANMVTVTVPIWAFKNNVSGEKISVNRRVTVNKLVADDFVDIMTEIYNDSERFPIWYYEEGGYYQVEGFTWKNVGGTQTPSQHTRGVAVDINANWNPQYTVPSESLFKIASNGSVVRIFTEHGWYWGGEYSKGRLDWMHFSLTEQGENSRI